MLENSSLKKKKANDNFWIAELERQLRTRNIHISGKQAKKTYFLSVDLSGKVKHVFVEKKFENFLRKTKNTKSNSESQSQGQRYHGPTFY